MFERKLAQSVQNDYLAAAEQHRLRKESEYTSNRGQAIIKIGLSLVTVAIILAVMSQYLAL